MIIKAKPCGVWCLLIVIYFSTLLIGYLTPMESDDFTFYLKGLSFSEHWSFYMTWSGRFVVDYISTLILSINNHLVIAAINSLALPLLIYNLALIPYYRLVKHAYDKSLMISIVILWWGYWLTNPALGQTTFWVVGAANYLWPLVFTALFFRCLLQFSCQSSLSKKQVVFVSLLAVLAGCSNEATGALTLYCLVFLYGWAYVNKLNKKLILGCFVVALIAYFFLFFAPGNMVRAGHSEYAAWRAMGMGERITRHFTYVIPQILKNYGAIYLFLIWAIVRGYKSLKKIDIQLLSIFIGAVILFCLILIASPHSLVARSQLTGLFFLLVILSFLLKVIFYDQKEPLFNNILFYILSIFFLFSYGCVVMAYYSFYQQGHFRVGMIEESKNKEVQEVSIPNYYRPFVLRNGDYPELDYHNPISMAEYYGIKKVNLKFVDFDYLSILNNPCMINYELITADKNALVKCIDIKKLLFSDTIRIVVEFSPKIAELEKTNRFALKVSNTFAESDERHYAINLPLRILKIGDHYFASVDVVASLLVVDKSLDIKLQVKGPVTEDGKDSIELFAKPM